MLAIEYHADLKEVQGDPALSALIAAQARAPFDRLEWWRALESECGLAPLIAVAREGEAIAVLPLLGGSGHVHALANWYNFTVRPLASASGAPLLAAIARDLRRRSWRVT